MLSKGAAAMVDRLWSRRDIQSASTANISANYLCYLGLIDGGGEEMVQDAVSRSIKPAFLKSLLPILK